MSAYAATARIDRVAPRLVIGARPGSRRRPRALRAREPDESVVDVVAVDDDDPLVDRLTAVRERWSQLTFYLFDAESWR